MTMMDRIKNMDERELALFIYNVSEGILEDECKLSCCGGKHLIDFDKNSVYSKMEYITDYLRSPIDF